MLKIALFVLFCAISGYETNGLPNEARVSTGPTNLKPMTVASMLEITKPLLDNKVTNSNKTAIANSSSNATDTSKMDSRTNTIVQPDATNTEKVSTVTNAPAAENTSSNTRGDESLPKMDEDVSKKVHDDTNTLTTSESIQHPNNITTTTTTTTTTSTTTTTTTTTPKPKTTTILPPTPAPVSPPSPGQWMVNETGQVCVLVKIAVQFTITNSTDKENKVFNLPSAANETKVSGKCEKSEQYITLQWNEGVNQTNTFTLRFALNKTTNQYSLRRSELAFLETNKTLVNDTPLFSTGQNSSYRCLKQQNMTLTQNGTHETMGYLVMSNLQFQAFKTTNTTDFGQVKDCKLETPDIVPIAVGCALASLVAIVLIAYLVGRKLNQGHGYHSM